MRYLQINIDYYRLRLLTEKAKMIYILALNIRNYEVQVKLETVLCLLKTLKMPCDIYKLLSINIRCKNVIYQSWLRHRHELSHSRAKQIHQSIYPTRLQGILMSGCDASNMTIDLCCSVCDCCGYLRANARVQKGFKCLYDSCTTPTRTHTHTHKHLRSIDET